MNKNETPDAEDMPYVLVVDDDPICQQFILNQLKEEKIDVVAKTAVDVDEAKALILEHIKKEQNFDIVFLDMFLKNNQLGTELLNIIKKEGWLKESLIIAMSGTEDQKIVEQAFDFKIQNFLRKPITKGNFKNEMIKVKKNHLDPKKCPIKGYKQLRFLGEGSNGKVFLVKEKKTKEKYALKSIKIQNTDQGPSKEIDEMKFLKGVDSSTVIKLKHYEFNKDDNILYLIIEYAEFGTLKEIIKEGKMIPDDRIINWMTELCLGLYQIHQMNLIHRDIKSENIFLCSGDVAKIGDLGAARALGEAGIAATMVGTTYYMSPEVIQIKEYNHKADIWSAGVVLYELMTNKLPFTGYDGDEIKVKITGCEYNSDLIPEERNPELKELLKHMLELNPTNRYSAKQCLEQSSILNKRLFSLIKSKVITVEGLDIKELTHNDQKSNPEFELGKQEYFNSLSIIKKIECVANKTAYNPGFFKRKIPDCITGQDLDNTMSDLKLKKLDINDLLNRKYMINLQAPTNLEFDDSANTFYKIQLEEQEKIDNSIKYPFEQKLTEDPITLSINCFNKVEKVLQLFNQLLGQQFDDENEVRMKISYSMQYFEFLIEIRKLKSVNIQKLSKDEKLVFCLNIYLTMFKHFQIKSILMVGEREYTFMESVMSLIIKPKPRLDVIYNISGHNISITEMKHVVIRRNKKPYENFFFSLASSSDPRINFIQESKDTELQKLLLICIDPPLTISENEDYLPRFKSFDMNSKISDQIEQRCINFYQEHIKIDGSKIIVPSYLKNYVNDFGKGGPADFIRFLVKFNKDPDFKQNFVIKNFNDGKLALEWE